VEKSKIPATGRPIARVVSDAEAQAELLDEDLNLAEMDAGSHHGVTTDSEKQTLRDPVLVSLLN
jgi:hypothetical protein